MLTLLLSETDWVHIENILTGAAYFIIIVVLLVLWLR